MVAHVCDLHIQKVEEEETEVQGQPQIRRSRGQSELQNPCPQIDLLISQLRVKDLKLTVAAV